MKEKTRVTWVPTLALVAGTVGYGLRKLQAGGGSGLPLAALSVVVTVVFALAAVTLEREACFSALFPNAGADRWISVPAGLAVVVWGFLSCRGGILQLLIAALGVMSGVVIAFDPLLRNAEAKKARYAYIVPVLFYTIKLFSDFRGWEIDPALTDYCYRLFACIGFMLASYYVGAYTFDKGGRRLLAFFSLVGVTFGLVSLQASALPELLFYSGSVLWMFRLTLDALHPIPSDAQASNE